ncbi:hypothetical protein P5V15_014066 [Pogonomyrmex californicus]
MLLASCLRGKTHAVLEEGTKLENSQFDNLVSRLELRFGEKFSAQTYYVQFINQKQNFREELASSDLKHLSRLAYPECPPGLQDKIARSQFIVALIDRKPENFKEEKKFLRNVGEC